MSPGPSPARSRIKAALPSPSTCPSSAGSRGPGLTGRGPGKSRKHHGWAAPLPLKIAPDRGCHAFRRPPGRGKGRRIRLRGRPTEWDRVGARAGRAVGRPACGSPSGSLGSLGCALRGDDGELLEFPAAGERGRPGEPAQRCSGRGAEPLDPRTRLRCSGGVGDFSARSRTSPGEAGGSPPPPRLRGWRGSRPALLGLGGGQGPGAGDAPPPAAWFPSRPVTSAKSQKPCGLLGRGRGRRRRHRGGQVARGAAAGKLGSGFLRPAEPRFLLELRRRRASLKEAALSQVPLLSQLPSHWATDRWEDPGSFPQLPQQLALGGDSAPCWSESGKETREGGPPISRSPEIQGSW